MKYKFLRRTAIAFVLGVLMLCSAGYAGNIDPDNDGSRYAWGENVGWINFGLSEEEGITVSDSAVTGYAWGENIGWLNLSPTNGGVFNDGEGNLRGYAWGENVGWINFAPTGGGVKIDPTTGAFSGKAWGENIGWITFAPKGKSVKTSWRGTVDNCPKQIDDGNPCTNDACDPSTGVVTHTPITDGTTCDDGSLCTENDVCTNGTCAGTLKLINDSNVCTTDACDPITGNITHIPVANGTTCDDGSLCTENDVCTNGTCAGTLKLIDDGNPCTTDACDLITGNITHIPVANGAACDDNNPATINDVCTNGTCAGTLKPNNFYGFFSPIDNPPNLNLANSGQTIPVKWRITDANGAPISDPASFRSLSSYTVSCDTYSGDVESALEEYSAGSSGLQYLGDGYWQFNWKTSKTYARQCRTMVLTLRDNSAHTSNFKFK
jgi:hypothetical protein